MHSLETIVSVYSLVYNHEPYLRSALDGFISQKTNFKYEVIVHDDASTDKSAEIIKEYTKKYPDIIKPIFQTENQYSKKIDIFNTFIIPRIKGKYIAICEGDDYWISSNKLQKQVDFLDSNPDYAACTHNTEVINFGRLIHFPKRLFSKFDVDLSFNDILQRSFHTSSIVYRREYLYNRPVFMSMQPGVGDFPLSIFLRLSGKIIRFGEVMSVYRLATIGSWSYRQKNDKNKQIMNKINSIKMLQAANEWSQYKYKSEIEKKILFLEYLNLLNQVELKKIKEDRYINFWKKETAKKKIKITLLYLLKRMHK